MTESKADLCGSFELMKSHPTTMPCWRYTGIELRAARAGWVRLKMPFKPELMPSQKLSRHA
jgi:acyl-coenzyme A thioesterase PaaI-like protein